jgi:hypothetical protein
MKCKSCKNLVKCGTVQIVVFIPEQEKQQMGLVPQERKQTPDNEHLSELTYLRHSSTSGIVIVGNEEQEVVS